MLLRRLSLQILTTLKEVNCGKAVNIALSLCTKGIPERAALDQGTTKSGEPAGPIWAAPCVQLQKLTNTKLCGLRANELIDLEIASPRVVSPRLSRDHSVLSRQKEDCVSFQCLSGQN